MSTSHGNTEIPANLVHQLDPLASPTIRFLVVTSETEFRTVSITGGAVTCSCSTRRSNSRCVHSRAVLRWLDAAQTGLAREEQLRKQKAMAVRHAGHIHDPGW